MGAPDILSVGSPLPEKYDNIGYEIIDCSTTLIVETQNSIKNIVIIVRNDCILQTIFGALDVTGPQATYMASLAIVMPLFIS